MAKDFSKRSMVKDTPNAARKIASKEELPTECIKFKQIALLARTQSVKTGVLST